MHESFLFTSNGFMCLWLVAKKANIHCKTVTVISTKAPWQSVGSSWTAFSVVSLCSIMTIHVMSFYKLCYSKRNLKAESCQSRWTMTCAHCEVYWSVFYPTSPDVTKYNSSKQEKSNQIQNLQPPDRILILDDSAKPWIIKTKSWISMPIF